MEKKWWFVIGGIVLMGGFGLWAALDRSLDDEFKLVIAGLVALSFVGNWLRLSRRVRNPRFWRVFWTSLPVLAVVALWSLYDHSLDDEVKIVGLGLLALIWVGVLVRLGRPARPKRRPRSTPTSPQGDIQPETYAVDCPSCGAPVPPEAKAGGVIHCAYCGASYSIEGG